MACHEIVRWISATGPWVTGAAVAWVAVWQLKSQKRIADRQHELEQDVARRQRDTETLIADRQAKLDEDKIRLDLFDRRFAVYVALENVLHDVSGESKDAEIVWNDFIWKLREGQFLFRDDVRLYLEEVFNRAILFRDLRSISVASWSERQFLQKDGLMQWLREHSNPKERIDLFGRYLNFDVLKSQP